VNVPSRAWEILLALIERAGQLVGKAELLARVWPRTVVEEGALRVHIAGLRKILGDRQDGLRYIENVTGQGYRFVAAVCQREVRRALLVCSSRRRSCLRRGDRFSVKVHRVGAHEHAVRRPEATRRAQIAFVLSTHTWRITMNSPHRPWDIQTRFNLNRRAVDLHSRCGVSLKLLGREPWITNSSGFDAPRLN